MLGYYHFGLIARFEFSINIISIIFVMKAQL